MNTINCTITTSSGFHLDGCPVRRQSIVSSDRAQTNEESCVCIKCIKYGNYNGTSMTWKCIMHITVPPLVAFIQGPSQGDIPASVQMPGLGVIQALRIAPYWVQSTWPPSDGDWHIDRRYQISCQECFWELILSFLLRKAGLLFHAGVTARGMKG